MSDNRNLSRSKDAKADEFYTQLSDIEKELRHYRKHFKGKVVLCNCDDPFESNFFKYFVLKFNKLGLKKLIATSYKGSPIAGTLFSMLKEEPEHPYKAVVTTVHDTDGDGGIDMLDVAELFRDGENELTRLEGDGDFRSQECLDLLDQADIVVTNPPFSLFREYVATLMEHEKSFLIIGNQNAITYKEIFPLLKENKVWLGNSSGHTLFEVPDSYGIPEFYDLSDKAKLRSNGYVVDENGKLWRNLGNICWFTNLDLKKRHEDIDLALRYEPARYPHYDNYDAIEVSKVAEIPYDYSGLMGVPITFMDKYSPDQFEILCLANGNARTNTSPEILAKVGYKRHPDDKGGLGVVNGKRVYARVIIRNFYPEPSREA